MNENMALVQRASVFSWEAMTPLLATVQEAPPVRVDFPRRVVILAAYPSVAWHSGEESLKFPTLDDLLVQIDVNTGFDRRITSRYDSVQPNGVGSFPQVTLGSFRDTTGGARVMNYELGAEGDKPSLTVTFGWKHTVNASSPVFQNVFASLVFHCNLMEGR